MQSPSTLSTNPNSTSLTPRNHNSNVDHHHRLRHLDGMITIVAAITANMAVTSPLQITEHPALSQWSATTSLLY
jgi:hypothetical protein